MFNAQYIDPKGLFVSLYDELPSAAFITEVNVHEAYPFLKKLLQARIHKLYQHSHYDYDSGRISFNVTFLVLDEGQLIEVGGDYVGIYYAPDQYLHVEKLLKQVAAFRVNKSVTNKIGFATPQELSRN